MEDWTDIIGEELESIEEPLPADDWSVLQQKYAASRRRKKAAAFAWAGGITSVAAAAALVLLLIHQFSFGDSIHLVQNQFSVTNDAEFCCVNLDRFYFDSFCLCHVFSPLLLYFRQHIASKIAKSPSFLEILLMPTKSLISQHTK